MADKTGTDVESALASGSELELQDLTNNIEGIRVHTDIEMKVEEIRDASSIPRMESLVVR
jgi:hypothetical protein